MIYKNIRLNELKKLELSELIKKYQEDSDSLMIRFRIIEKEAIEKKKRSINNVMKLLSEYSDYYEAFFHKQVQLKNIPHKKHIQISRDNKIIEMYIQSCIIHINRINNNYLIPSTLRSARTSIIMAMISLIIGFGSIVYSINVTKLSANKLEKYTSDNEKIFIRIENNINDIKKDIKIFNENDK